MILDNNVLPLIIALSILIGFAGFEWWRWYFDIPAFFPFLITGIAFSLGIYYYHKLTKPRKHKVTEEIYE